MVFRCGSVEIDPKTREIRREGRVVHAEPKVLDLLLYLVQHRDRLATKQELLDAIWPDTAVGEAALSRCVSLARKALGDSAQIAAVHGRGYRFVDARIEAQEELRSMAPWSVVSPAPTSAFVGREQSLAAALDRLALAEKGRGGVCFVYGEAGIGKSRFLLELAARVSARQVLVLRGESPDAEGAPAFWPWLQVLRRLARSSDAAEVLRIIGVASSADTGASGTSLQNRLLFFEQVAEVLGSVAEAHPLVLLFDDVHQADLPSLHLFTYLARVCVDRRILLVGTYRDVELAADAERSAALAPAWRAQALSIELQGLSVEAVAELVSWQSNVPNLSDMASSLKRKTGGNPFFLTQLLPLLAAGNRPVSEIEAPRGVRDVIRRQIHGLGAECNDVMAAAAVVGVQFEASWLSILGFPIATVLYGLQRASYANLVRRSLDYPSRFEFVHGLVRDVLYEDLDPEKRSTLHQDAARLFESLPGLDEELRLAAVVHHLGRALPLGSAQHALKYTVRAATHALSRYAYETACDYFERALRILETRAVQDNATLFSVLLDLGHAQAQAGRRDKAHTTFDRAADIARSAGFSDGIARVALRAVSGSAINEPLFTADHHQITLLRDGLDALGSREPRLNALLRGRLAVALYASSEWEERNELLHGVDGLLQETDDDGLRGELIYARLSSLWRPENIEDRLRWADEALFALRKSRRSEYLPGLQTLRFALGLELGNIAFARASAEGFKSACVDLHYPSWFADGFCAVLLFLEGKLVESDALCTTLIRIAERMQQPGALQSFGALSSILRIELGQANKVVDGLREFGERFRDVPGWRAVLAFALAKADRLTDAATEFEHLAERSFPIPRDTTWLGCMAMLSYVCSKLQDRRRASILKDALAPFADCHAIAGLGAISLGSMHHFLGLLSRVSGAPQAALQHFESAIASNAKLGAPLFVAHTQHEYAALLRFDGSCYDPKRADALEKLALETAISCGATQLEREIAEATAFKR